MKINLLGFSFREGFKRILWLTLLLAVGLPLVAPAQTPVQNEVAKLVASDGALADTFASSVSVSGGSMFVGAPEADAVGPESGAVYVFEGEAASWSETAKLTGDDTGTWDLFGTAVAVSGDVAVVGVPHKADLGPRTGAAYVFERGTDGTWVQAAKLLADDADEEDYFGYPADVSGETLIVGASADEEQGAGSGSAYIFERQSGTWIQTAKLLADDGDEWDSFGIAVAVSGNVAVVGARSDEGGGSAYVFELLSGDWTQTAKLSASDAVSGDYFGVAVSMFEDVIVVGASWADHAAQNSGAAYVFERQPELGWVETAKLVASDGAEADLFGSAVSIHDDAIVISARVSDPVLGVAYLFRRDNGTWLEAARLMASDGQNDDRFGAALDMSTGLAVIGASYDDDNGTESGSAYLFEIAASQQGCHPVVEPPSLDFGAIKVGEIVTLSTTLTNEGDEACDIAAYVASPSGEFALNAGSPASFAVAPGESADVLVDYGPVDMDADTGTLELAIADPASQIDVALTGSAAEEVFDLDIAQFRASRAIRYRDGSTRPISITLAVGNEGTLPGSVLATVVGVRADSVEVYREILEVTDDVGGAPQVFEYPAYVPEAIGDITWTVTFDDGYPDGDEATATTRVW